MNCLLAMKIKWSLDINTGAVERSEAARARRLAGATVVEPVTARADQLWHAETGPPDQIWRRTNYSVTGPPPSRDRDLELEGGVNACHRLLWGAVCIEIR